MSFLKEQYARGTGQPDCDPIQLKLMRENLEEAEKMNAGINGKYMSGSLGYKRCYKTAAKMGRKWFGV